MMVYGGLTSVRGESVLVVLRVLHGGVDGG